MYEVINLSWTRSNLTIQLDKAVTAPVFLTCENKKYILDTQEDSVFIPLTNLPNKGMIEEGKWYICIGSTSNTTEFEHISISSHLLESLEDKSRIMKYSSEYCALIIVPSADENLYFYIDANYMMRNTKYKKGFRTAMYSTAREKIKAISTILAVKCLNLAYHFLYFFNCKRNLVLFLSENDDELSNNFKNLYEYVSKEHKTFTFNHNLESNRSNRAPYRIKELLACSKAKYIFLDNYAGFLSAINIPKSQVLAQVWHAGVGFKSVGYARFGKAGSPHPFVSVHRKYDYAFVDDTRLIDIYSEVFGLDKSKFVVSGLPRLDNYTSENRIDKTINHLFEAFPQLQDKKTILFSPTFRGSHSYNAYYDFSQLDFDKINDFCIKNDFLFLIKMHPFISQKPDVDVFSNILDLSSFEINDLIYVSDIMITDYSSCCYEFSFFNRPLIFYRYDKDLYEYLRPMHTLDIFTEKQFEVTDFNSLMDTLDSLKDIDISNRFTNIKERSNNSLEIISKTVFGEDE